MANGLRAISGRSYSSIELAARAARGVFGVGTDLAPGIKLFERLDEYETSTAKGTVPIEWGVKAGLPAEGLTMFRPDLGEQGAIELLLREDVYEALRRDDARARFTMMHELAHVMLHAEDLVQHGALPHFGASFRRAGRVPHPQYMDTEWQANAWAAAFLMPARDLNLLDHAGALSPNRLQRRFGVSAEAASLRIKVFHERRAELTG